MDNQEPSIIPHHYSDRYYFGEIFKTNYADLGNIEKMLPDSVKGLVNIGESSDNSISYHGWYESQFPFDVVGPNSKTKQRTKLVGGITYYEYDVFLVAKKSVQSGIWYYCVSVPFVRLGKILFEEVEYQVARLGIKYARVNLTGLVHDLTKNQNDDLQVENTDEPKAVLTLKKYDCQYLGASALKKISLSGDDLLSYKNFDLFVQSDYQPTLCGFSYTRGTKASLINVLTDRKGNYRFWLGKGWGRVFSLFDLISEFERREILSPTGDRPSAKTQEISNEGDS